MQANIIYRSKDCQVADVATDEDFTIMPVKKGDVILVGARRCLISAEAASDSVWQLRLNTANVQLGGDKETEDTVNDLVDFDIVQPVIVEADDTIIARYVDAATDGAIAPKARVGVMVARAHGWV